MPAVEVKNTLDNAAPHNAINWSKYHEAVGLSEPVQAHGRVTKVVGLVTEAKGPVTNLGGVCDIYAKDGTHKITAEVLGFRDNKVLLMPLEEPRGISPGSRVVARESNAAVAVGPGLLGRVIDGLGVPIDKRGAVAVARM